MTRPPEPIEWEPPSHNESWRWWSITAKPPHQRLYLILQHSGRLDLDCTWPGYVLSDLLEGERLLREAASRDTTTGEASVERTEEA